METGQRQQVEQNEVKQVEGLKNKTGNVFFLFSITQYFCQSVMTITD